MLCSMELYIKNIHYQKIYTLLVAIFVFSVIYFFLDDKHFSGVNIIKETIKKEVIKKEVEEKISQTPNLKKSMEPFENPYWDQVFSDIQVKKTLGEATKEVKEDVEEQELTPEKIETPFYQRFFDRFYFSMITSTLLGYGDIYPTTNICKMIVMLQSLITTMLIVS